MQSKMPTLIKHSSSSSVRSPLFGISNAYFLDPNENNRWAIFWEIYWLNSIWRPLQAEESAIANIARNRRFCEGIICNFIVQIKECVSLVAFFRAGADIQRRRFSYSIEYESPNRRVRNTWKIQQLFAKQEQTQFEDLLHGYECRKKENLKNMKHPRESWSKVQKDLKIYLKWKFVA